MRATAQNWIGFAALRGKLTAVLAALLLAVACSSGAPGSDATAGPGATPSSGATTGTGAGGTSPAAPTTRAPRPFVSPTEIGPYKVGRETITVASADGSRSRVADVWYPVDPAVTGQSSIYQLEAFPGLAIASPVALEGVAVAPDGPFPLVVYSHGSGGLRFIASFFTEALASHGFVVASVDHVGDTVVDLKNGTSTANDEVATIGSRAADVSLTIDALLSRSGTAGDPLAGAVDPGRIGVTGHSYGGLTAIAATAGLHPYTGRSIPPDPRIKVVVTMDPSTNIVRPQDMVNLTVPMLTITGQVDPNPSGPHVLRYAKGEQLEVRLDQAGHLEFTDVCRYQEIVPTLANPDPIVVAYVNSLADQDCHPPHMPVAQVHEATNRYAIAFLLRHLAGDERAQAALGPDGGSGVGVLTPAPVEVGSEPDSSYVLPDDESGVAGTVPLVVD